jgi:hypothetical protein
MGNENIKENKQRKLKYTWPNNVQKRTRGSSSKCLDSRSQSLWYGSYVACSCRVESGFCHFPSSNRIWFFPSYGFLTNLISGIHRLSVALRDQRIDQIGAY